jgi:hypothetical protein
MGKRKYELDTRVLTIFFFVAIPFVALGSFLVVTMATGQLQESLGSGLEQRAIQTKVSLERYVADQIVHLLLISIDPQVQQAVSSPPPLGGDARRREQAWASGADAKSTAPLLESPLAARLRDLVQVRPVLKLLQIVDANGRLVASSSRAGRLVYAEAAWFKSMSKEEGQMLPYVGDIYRQPGGSFILLDLAYPIQHPDGRWLGAVRALIDATDLYGVLAPVRIGRSGHAVLLRSSDGQILASDENERILQQPLLGFASLDGALNGFPMEERGQMLFGRSHQRRGYWTLPALKGKAPGGREVLLAPARLVGYAPVEQVPNVKWLVVVEQELEEATAPIAGVTRYLWIHFIEAFGAVILLALYFSFRAETPVIEEELHLHEEHLPGSMKSARS